MTKARNAPERDCRKADDFRYRSAHRHDPPTLQNRFCLVEFELTGDGSEQLVVVAISGSEWVEDTRIRDNHLISLGFFLAVKEVLQHRRLTYRFVRPNKEFSVHRWIRGSKLMRSPNLDMPFIAPAQAQKHVTHNEAISRLDAVSQLVLTAVDADVPPTNPEEGAIYALSAAPSGVWSGSANQLAVWINGGWDYVVPRIGWVAYSASTADQRVWDGSTWVELVPADLSQLQSVGINTTADTINRLSVSGDATLLSHDGGSHRVVVNKASAGETASLLYQSNWAGRSEIGLAGDDDLQIKVSSNGTDFVEAIRVSNSSATTAIRCSQSGSAQIANDAVTAIELPSSAGFVLITAVQGAAADSHAGIFTYDVNTPTLLTLFAAGQVNNAGTMALDGQVGNAGQTSVSVSGSTLQIENRSGAPATFSYTFIGGL
ncbi:MAG: DUF2793 domain-containing protein [Pseudomonadota bacterium]